MKKYELIEEKKTIFGTTLYRIRALIDFDDVKSGALGGLVAKEENLSQDGACWVSGKAQVSGDAWVSDGALVCGDADIFCVEHIGSRNDSTTFYRTEDGAIRVNCGCFSGTLPAFKAAVQKTHGSNKHGRVYQKAIEMALIQMEKEET